MQFRSLIPALFAAIAIFALPACHGPASGSSDFDARDEIGTVWAECQVCKCNCDLACVRVKVEPTTPRAEVNGVTWYFCSEDCRDDFVAHSKKYLAH